MISDKSTYLLEEAKVGVRRLVNFDTSNCLVIFWFSFSTTAWQMGRFYRRSSSSTCWYPRWLQKTTNWSEHYLQGGRVQTTITLHFRHFRFNSTRSFLSNRTDTFQTHHSKKWLFRVFKIYEWLLNINDSQQPQGVCLQFSARPMIVNCSKFVAKFSQMLINPSRYPTED